MEVILCLSVAILLVSARTSAQWWASAQTRVPSQTFPQKAVVGIVRILSFACAGFALGLIDGFLMLGLSGSRWNVGIPVLIAFIVPAVSIVLWGTFLAVRIWVSRSLPDERPRASARRKSCEEATIADSIFIR